MFFWPESSFHRKSGQTYYWPLDQNLPHQLEKIKTDRDYHLLVMYVFVYLFKCKYLLLFWICGVFLIIIRNTWRHILARSQKFPMWDNTNAIRSLVKSINGITMLHADSGSILLILEDVRVSGFTLGLFQHELFQSQTDDQFREQYLLPL